MSASQIIQELPKLTREERKIIIHRAMDLNADEQEAEEWAEASGLALLQFIDQTEDDESRAA
jgi:uncharacterized protein Smg (DUF494 family)